MKSVFYGLVFMVECFNIPMALGQELVIAAPARLDSTEPIGSGDAGDVMWRGNVYEALVGVGKDLNLVPSLAVSWEYNGAGLLLRLRAGCRFTNGDVLNSADVAASLLNAQEQGYFPGLRIEVVNDHTIQAIAENTRVPLAAWLMYLPIIPKGWVDGDRGASPAGTGPYQLVDIQRGSLAIFERNAGWWGWTETGVHGTADRITLLNVSDTSAQLNRLASGDADLLWDRTEGNADKGDEMEQFVQRLAQEQIRADYAPGGIIAQRPGRVQSIEADWYGIRWGRVQTSY
ncbi:ABC transporter substrate-binding protein [Rhizobium leguminosarum]|uniref:ABC transporter substrate-binding protein n=1 Tax=Rhizobium leguminosarum TaxID=384 RepID=UPI003F98187D